VAAPGTAGTEKDEDPEGHTLPGPFMIPGVAGVLLNVMLLTELVNPQFKEAYTLNDPLVQPARKLTVTLGEAEVNVAPPPLMVAFPVTVHV
jgi:hypothetical protein